MQSSVPLYVLYLLCARPPGAAPAHYVGITTQGSFAQRMQDHASGNGTTTTAKWYNAGVRFWLSAIHLTDDHNDEARLARITKRPEFRCHLCERIEDDRPEDQGQDPEARIKSRHLLDQTSFTSRKAEPPK